MNNNLLDLFWEGFELESYEQLDARRLQIRLKSKASHLPTCSHCGRNTPLIHDFSYRRVRERDLFDYQVWLEVPVRRVRCPDCGPRREHIDWLPGRLALTQGMVSWVETLVRLMPIKHVSALLNLHWHKVKAIDQRRLAR